MAKKAPKAPAKSTPTPTAKPAAPAPPEAPKAQATAEPPKAEPPKAEPPKAAPAPKAPAKPLEGFTVKFVHPGNRTLALPRSRAALEAAGAETTEGEIPRHLVNMSRLNKVYGPSLELAQIAADLVTEHLTLTAVQGNDPAEKALYVFID